MPRAAIARSRAPTVFLLRIETIRSKNTVMVKTKDSLGLFLYKIADRARIAFYPCTIGDPRGRIFVRAKWKRCNNGDAILSRHV